MDKKNNLKEIMTINGMDYKDVSYITGAPYSTVFKWMNGRLKPSDSAIILIHSAIKSARLILTKEFDNDRQRIVHRAYYWGRKNRDQSIS